MKSLFALFTLLLISGTFTVYAQFGSTENHENKSGLRIQTISYELGLGSSFLSNTEISKNKPFSGLGAFSGNFNTFIEIPLQISSQPTGFFIKPGAGISVKTFGLNKTLQSTGGKTVFESFSESKSYTYSHFQQVFADIPLMLGYRFFPEQPGRQYSVEVGGQVGYQIYAYGESSVKNKEGYTVSFKDDFKNINPVQVAGTLKVSTSLMNQNDLIGFSWFLSGTYFFSDVFKSANLTPGKSFSIMAGIGLIFNKN